MKTSNLSHLPCKLSQALFRVRHQRVLSLNLDWLVERQLGVDFVENAGKEKTLATSLLTWCQLTLNIFGVPKFRKVLTCIIVMFRAAITGQNTDTTFCST